MNSNEEKILIGEKRLDVQMRQKVQMKQLVAKLV
jgi:hypothetical protein